MKNTSSEESLRKIITDGYDNLLINKKINTNNIYIKILTIQWSQFKAGGDCSD
jgi:hypothetical protein